MELTDDQRELQAVLKRAFDDKLTSGRLRASLTSDDELWDLTAHQLAMHGLVVPEQHGGSGASAAEQLVLLEQAAAAVVPGPFFATVVLAGSMLVEADSAAHLPALADGSLRSAFAWYTSDLPAASVGPAEPSGDGWVVSGTATAVLDGADAELLVVVAEGPVLLAVRRPTDRVVAEPLTTLDLTRPAATLTFDRAPAELLAGPDTAAFVVRRGVQRATLALAAEQVGGAQRCLDMAVAYAGMREQFGRPIGSFQAVKHKLADMLVRVELARSLATYATAHDDDRWTAAAAALCSETYLSVATDTIQVHGGIGFTWEHDAHLHYRRARADHAMLGTPRQHREALAGLLTEGAA